MAGVPEPAAGAEARVGRETAATSPADRRETATGASTAATTAANAAEARHGTSIIGRSTRAGACPLEFHRADTSFHAVSGRYRARSGTSATTRPDPGQPAPARGEASGHSDRAASLPRRLGALLYETLLLLAMAFVVGFLFLPLVSPAGASHQALTVPPVFARAMMFCALAGGAAIYYRWCWSDGRRTLPQKTWRIRIVDRHGRPLTRRRALLRYTAGWIGPVGALIAYVALRPTVLGRYAIALLCLNYAWALVDRERQFLHDRIAGTRVVQDV